MRISILKLLLIIGFFIAPLSGGAQPVQEEEIPTLESFDLLGKVQDIKLNLYEVEEGQSAKGDLKSSTVFKFNQEGGLSEKTEYAPDKSVREQEKYVYDDRGNPIDRTVFENVRNHATYRTTAEYDKAGNMIKGVRFNPDGSIAEKQTQTNNDRGNPIEIAIEQLNSESQAKFLFKYDNEGNKIEEKRYYNDDLDWEYQFRYDDDGKLIEQTEIRGGAEHPEYKTSYTYDSKGRKIEEEELIYDPDGTVGATTKIYYTYDEEGNRRKVYKEFEDIGREQWHKRTMEYDENRNLLNDRQEHSSAMMNYDRRAEYEFDSHGNWLRKKEFEENQLKRIVERELNYFGD